MYLMLACTAVQLAAANAQFQLITEDGTNSLGAWLASKDTEAPDTGDPVAYGAGFYTTQEVVTAAQAYSGWICDVATDPNTALWNAFLADHGYRVWDEGI